MILYFKWDGSPADEKSADWIVSVGEDRNSFTAHTMWDVGVSVFIYRGSAMIRWVLPLRVGKALFPAIFDLNTLAELLLAQDTEGALQFLRQKPFKPASLYGKPEELKFFVAERLKKISVKVIRAWPRRPVKSIRLHGGLIKTFSFKEEVRTMWVGPEALAPMYAKLPYGEYYGCVVYDAWGNPAELKTVVDTGTVPKSDWLNLPRVEIREGWLPGAGWIICWTKIDVQKLAIRFYPYVHFKEYGAAHLIEGFVETVVKDRRVWFGLLFVPHKPVWVPNINAALADMLSGELREETA